MLALRPSLRTLTAVFDYGLHPKQGYAYGSEANEILYGGAAGGGKSHLKRAIAIHGCVGVPGLQVYLFRRLSDDLYKNHMEGAGGFFAMLKDGMAAGYVAYNDSKRYIKFWNGSKIWLCHCQHEKDRFKYQGAEIHMLLIDELTHFTDKIYRYLRARTRIGELAIPEGYTRKLPYILCGTNPGGIGHNWVKRTFVDMKPAYQIHRTVKQEGGKLRQFIPALLSDNPSMAANDPDYADTLSGLGDPALVKAMLEGDWNIVAGGALDDVWHKEHCIKPRFKVPESWRVDRSFDWGSTHPFSVGWWAEADGSEATMPDGSKFCPPSGSIIRVAEWYGTKEVGTNEGLKMAAGDIAQGIVDIEKDLKKEGWIVAPVKAGPADNQIGDVREADTPTIKDKMAKKGIRWKESDKSPGSRKIGLDLLRERLAESAKEYPEEPCIYFMQHCMAAISTLPVLPRDEKKPDDVDTNSEDHVYDEVRYRVLAGKRAVKKMSMGMAS